MTRKKKQTKKQMLIRFIKRIPLYLRYGPFMLFWCFYDYVLTLWVYVKDIDFVGVYVKILSPSEEALLFDEEGVGYGYTGFTLIKIGYKKQWTIAEAVENLLSHEILHQVLRKHISGKASHKLDDVHESRKSSAIICEDGKVKLLWKIKFPI